MANAFKVERKYIPIYGFYLVTMTHMNSIFTFVLVPDKILSCMCFLSGISYFYGLNMPTEAIILKLFREINLKTLVSFHNISPDGFLSNAKIEDCDRLKAITDNTYSARIGRKKSLKAGLNPVVENKPKR